MNVNYHIHTRRCNHAAGTPREYIETAIKRGFRTLGFSDHVPYPFSCAHTSGIRMRVSETEAYVKELAALREEYRDRIRILIGYEAEYYPKDFQAMLNNICSYECDYLILGQHFTCNEYDGHYAGRQTEDKEILIRYVEQVIEALDTKKFSCLAHPDLIHYCGDDSFYCLQMRRICKHAKELGIPLEINLLGLEEGRHYPRDLFWPLAAEEGNAVILGCDAHRPDAVGNPKMERAGREYAARFGIKLVEEMEPVRPAG